MFRTGQPLAVDDVLAEIPGEAMPTGMPPIAARLDPGAGLLLPMLARGRTVVGVLSLVRRRGRPAYGDDELRLYADVARRAGVALDNARLFAQRSRIATRLQQALLPAELPAVPGIELAAHYRTAEEAVEVGGDFYDVFPTGPHRWCIVVGDVAGRGVDAAGATGLARQTLRAIGHDHTPAAALARLNTVLYDQQAAERFLTAVCGRLTRQPDGSFTLALASGGHPPPLLMHTDGTHAFLGTPDTLLDAFPTVDLTGTRHTLRPGDTLILYADGITETRGAGGLFGERRLAAVATTCADRPADATAGRLLDTVLSYRTSPTADDAGDAG